MECKAEDCVSPVQVKSGRGRPAVYCSKACAKRQGHRNSERKERYESYGATPEDYDRLFKEQNGRCAICNTDKPGGHGKAIRFAFDHDHAEEKPRGLLCYSCNVGLGYFRDSSLFLTNAAAYLEKYSISNAINPVTEQES